MWQSQDESFQFSLRGARKILGVEVAREVRAGGARKILEAEEIADKIDEVVAESTVGAITDKAAERVEETIVEPVEALEVGEIFRQKVAAEEDARGHGQGLGQVRRHLWRGV